MTWTKVWLILVGCAVGGFGLAVLITSVVTARATRPLIGG